jgi:hypothetical protein
MALGYSLILKNIPKIHNVLSKDIEKPNPCQAYIAERKAQREALMQKK